MESKSKSIPIYFQGKKTTNSSKDNKNVNNKKILYKCPILLSDISLDEPINNSRLKKEKEIIQDQ